MRVTPKVRAWLLGSALIATLTAAFAPTEPSAPPTVRPLIKPRTSADPADSEGRAADIPSITISRLGKAKVTTDPFSNAAWQPAPPPVLVAPPVSPPPQLPYAFQGLLDDRGHFVVLLARGEISQTARVGDILDGIWRVDAIGVDAVDFDHLPTHTRHTLSIGRAS